MIIEKGQLLCDHLYRVLKARGIYTNHYWLTGLHVETIGDVTYAVASDGERLHYDVIDDLSIKAGDYSVPVCKRNQIVLEPAEGNFPNWCDIVPKSFSHMVEWEYSKDKPGSLFIFYQITKLPVNPKFLTDLDEGHYMVYWTKANKAIAIREGSFVAIVMPLSLKDGRPEVQRGTFVLDNISRRTT